MKHGRKALLVALCLSCFLTACAPKMETPNQTNPSASTNTDHTQNSDGGQDFGAVPERDPNAEYIQDYYISTLGISSYTASSTGYTDSKYYWARLRADKNTGKINTDSWAAIDETGKIYGIVPLENESDDVEWFNEFLCVEETRLYKYDGSEVTSQYLNNGETLLRITKCDDDFAIWKYQTDKKYQEETVYTLRVCNTKGKILFEIDSRKYDGTDGLCRFIQYGESPAFIKLSNNLYYVQYCNIIDLSTGNIYDIEQYDAVQKLKQYASKHYQYNFLNNITAIDDVLYVSVPTEDGNANCYAYKAGAIEHLYSVNGIYKMFPTLIEGRFLSPDGDMWALYDIYTGEQVYITQNSLSSFTYDEIEYSTKYNVYIEQVGDFVGVFSEDGAPCFEPIEGKLIANWLDYNGNLLIQYKGHAYDGAGLYVVDMNGNMTMLSITGSAFALNAQNRIMVVDGGVYKLYDENWNKLY